MSKVINLINKGYYKEGELLYKKDKVEFEPGLTVLVGCNGSGKTTMLYQIKHQLQDEDIKFLFYDNSDDSGALGRERAGYYGDLDLLQTLIISSEGENNMHNVGIFSQKLGKRIWRTHKNEKEFWVLIDGLDSGLSIDNIIELKNFFNMVTNIDEKEIYIILSTNQYEFTTDTKCLDVYKTEYTSFRNYEEYKEFIIKSREIKNKRYKK